MKKKTIGIIAGVTAGAAVTAFGGISYHMMASATGGRRQTYEEALAWQKEHYDTAFFDGLAKEDYTVVSGDGYVLHALFVKNPADTDRYVILTHGYTDNRYGTLKYMKIYLDLGFNCICYDLRGHGENAPAPCTYGINESRDLLAMIADTRSRHPDISVLGLHGESLGAATTVTVLGEKPPVDFAVADCGFADIGNVLEGTAAYMHLPKAVVKCASAFAKMKTGYAFSQMRPIDHLAENEIPVMFIHGAEDTFILPSNSERMHEATKGYSELHLIPGASHAQSVLTAPEQYADYVGQFLEKVLT